jgi:hypothetical protein
VLGFAFGFGMGFVSVCFVGFGYGADDELRCLARFGGYKMQNSVGGGSRLAIGRLPRKAFAVFFRTLRTRYMFGISNRGIRVFPVSKIVVFV